MPGSLVADVERSIADGVRARKAFDASIDNLAGAIAARDFDRVETIREEMKAAIDSFVDAYASAASRVDYERAGRGRSFG